MWTPRQNVKDAPRQTGQVALGGRHWLPRLLFCGVVLAVLVGLGVWLNQPREGEATAASQLVFTPARVTAVLSDNAAPDEENGEGRRVGSQELEIQLLSGPHKDEILPLTNHMSALFNVDVEEGDRVIVRLITQEDGTYYAAMFNYDRGLVMGITLLVFCAVLALLGGREGDPCSAGAGVYPGLRVVFADPWPHPGATGDPLHRGHRGGDGGSLPSAAGRVHPEELLRHPGLHRRRGGGGDLCRPGGGGHPTQRL